VFPDEPSRTRSPAVGAGRPDAWSPDPESEARFAGQHRDQTPEERRTARSQAALAIDPDDLFSVTEVFGSPPNQARIFRSVPCARCREDVMETRIRRLDGQELCQPCFDVVLTEA